MMRMKLASPCSMVFTRPSLNVPFPVPITFSPRASDFELRHLRFFPWYYDRRSDQKGSFPAFSFLSSFRPASIFFEPSLSVESSFSAFPLVRGRSEEIGDRILSAFSFVFLPALPYPEFVVPFIEFRVRESALPSSRFIDSDSTFKLAGCLPSLSCGESSPLTLSEEFPFT